MPSTALLGSVPQQPLNKPFPSDCSLPGAASGKEPQPAEPGVDQGGTTGVQHRRTVAASAQGIHAAQRTQHQHISLKETYREAEEATLNPSAALFEPAVPGGWHTQSDRKL